MKHFYESIQEFLNTFSKLEKYFILIHSLNFQTFTSSNNGKTKIKIKEHFIEYLQALEKQQKIRSEVLILPSNETHNIHQITYRLLRAYTNTYLIITCVLNNDN